MTIADIFADAQKSSINHKTLTKRLRKIEKKNESNRSRFEEQVKQCVLRCLEVSKPEKSGQNIVKFICSYCAAVESQEREHEDEEGNNVTSTILIALLPFMSAKDKVVRYRATQIVSQLMGVVQELDDDLYQAIRHELIKRIRDKVPAIRLEAVCALGRLLENEMDEEAQAAQERGQDDDDEIMSDEEETDSTGLLGKLLDVLQNDTNADVRKALLLNLPVDPKTQPYLLERARDKDAATRRAVYSKLMPKMEDFRYLNLTMREKLLRWGLRDRDEKVRAAAAKMFSTQWIEQVAKTLEQTEAREEEPEQPKRKRVGYHEPSMPALHELLERLDILNNGHDEGVGLEAMREFWRLRSDYFEEMSFDDDFWANLDVESAFMARSFYEYCSQNPHAQAQAEERMPEVTRFGYHLQKHLSKVINVRLLPDDAINEDELVEEEFITEQLLHIAHTLDYTDEIGRRKLFDLLRKVIADRSLPDEATKLAIEVLRLTCTPDSAGEREFITIVQEAMADVRDDPDQKDQDTLRPVSREQTPADDESFVSAQSEIGSPRSDTTARAASQRPKSPNDQRALSPEEAAEKEYQKIYTQLKSLNMAHTLLQNITCDVTKHIPLDTMLNTLIFPAIHSKDIPVLERAIECMGLACLLSPTLAAGNWDLFVFCMRKGSDAIKKSCLQILCDCAVTHRSLLGHDAGIDLQPFVRAFGYSPDVAAVSTACVARLMLCGLYLHNEGEGEGEGEDEIKARFDGAVEEAQRTAVRGWEVLVKVQAALVADGGASGRKGLVEDGGGERRTS